MQAVKRDATLRPSEFSWMMESQFGSRRPLRLPIGGRRVADRVIGQLRRPASGVRGMLPRVAGVLLGIATAFFGIPLFIMGLLWLTAKNVLLLPVFLAVWLAAVVLLLAWGMRPRAARSRYRRAMVRLADLSYCSECDAVFETESGRVVPIDRQRDVLYAAGAGSASVNYLAQRS